MADLSVGAAAGAFGGSLLNTGVDLFKGFQAAELTKDLAGEETKRVGAKSQAAVGIAEAQAKGQVGSAVAKEAKLTFNVALIIGGLVLAIATVFGFMFLRRRK